MSVLSVCSRRCLGFNWGVMSVFLAENFKFGSMGCRGEWTNGVTESQPHTFTRVPEPCAPRGLPGAGAGPPAHALAFSRCLTDECAISLRLGLVVLLAPAERQTLRGAACGDPGPRAVSRRPSLLCTALLLLSSQARFLLPGVLLWFPRPGSQGLLLRGRLTVSVGSCSSKPRRPECRRPWLPLQLGKSASCFHAQNEDTGRHVVGACLMLLSRLIYLKVGYSHR